MRAIVVTAYGDSSVLNPVERPDPTPGPGEVLVDVAAAGVNFIDIYQREGLYPVPLPFIPGLEGAGTVAAVGPGVTDLVVGDRIGWSDVLGSYASRVVVPASRAIRLPEGLSPETAAAVLLQGLTAHYLTHSTHTIQQGDNVLVHAAAGGVGLLLIQMAKLRGARVIGTVSTPEKEKLARQAGADEVISYEDFPEKVKRITGAGVDVVYDGVGAATFDGSLASLRPRGLLALYGAASGPVPPFDLQRLNLGGSLFVTRPSLNHYIATREELLSRAGELLGWVASGAIQVSVFQRYPLAEAQRAHTELEGRRTTGKVLLIP